MSELMTDLPERLLAKLMPSPDGCWLWTASLRDGYGLVRWDGRMQQAHRVIYELLVGSIPQGLQIDHLCRVRCCVNPTHVEPVTQKENILRGTAPSAQNATQTHCKYGHPFDDENTYLHPHNGGRGCRQCRKRVRRQNYLATLARES